MTVDYAKDEQFFEFVHELAHRPGSGRGSERRDRQRRPYPCHQFVAPFRDARMPENDEYQPVLCHDLSTGGFSYFTDELPDHDLIVVAFGAAPKFTYITAQVRYAKRVAQGASALFQIGCMFLGRINLAPTDARDA